MRITLSVSIGSEHDVRATRDGSECGVRVARDVRSELARVMRAVSIRQRCSSQLIAVGVALKRSGATSTSSLEAEPSG